MLVFKRPIILFAALFLAWYPCFSQTSRLAEPVTEKYNSFLRSTHLDHWIRATGFSNSEALPVADSIKLNHPNIFVLEAHPDFTYPVEIAPIWDQLVKRFGGGQYLYDMLFSRLIDFSGKSPDSVAVYFKSADPALFSFVIYKHNGISYTIQTMTVRDPSGSPDFGNLDDSSAGGQIRNVRPVPGLEQLLKNELSKFLKNSKHTSEVHIVPQNWGKGLFRLVASNIKGEVTPNLFERISVNVVITPAEDNRVNISYFFAVLCAGGILRAPSELSEYKNASADFQGRVLAYGARLKQCLSSVIERL